MDHIATLLKWPAMDDDTPIWDLPSDHDVLAQYVSLAGSTLVDVGAGDGALVRFARRSGAEAIGVECGAAQLAKARAADPVNADIYLDGVGQDLPLDDESADVVVMCYSMHHIPGELLATALQEADRVLRTGGTLAVLEPIATGGGHEVFKPIDDETAVRAAAQLALDRDLPASLTELDEVRYTTSYSYADIAELEQEVVDIDPSRRDLVDAARDEVAQLFEKHGVPHDGRRWFDQPVVMRRFSKG